jgi:GT2 family glycosyltransferase
LVQGLQDSVHELVQVPGVFPAAVSALIVNWRSTDWLLPCLEALLSVPEPLARVVVIDNASGDESVARIRHWAREHGVGIAAGGGELGGEAWLVLLEASENRGYAAGNNIGLSWLAARADFSHVWLLNPDTQVRPSALDRMLARMAKDAHIGTCGGTLVDMEEPRRVQCYGGGRFHYWTARPPGYKRWR